jgi:hypothetical protein
MSTSESTKKKEDSNFFVAMSHRAGQPMLNIADAVSMITDGNAAAVVIAALNTLVNDINSMKLRVASLESAVAANQALLTKYKHMAERTTQYATQHALIEISFMRTLETTRAAHRQEILALQLRHHHETTKIMMQARDHVRRARKSTTPAPPPTPTIKIE